MRQLIYIVAIGVSLILVGSARAEMSPVLLNHVFVQNDLVKLKHVFENLPRDLADVKIMKAPNPGQQVVLSPVNLMRLAKQFKIDWKPTSQFDQVVIERAGQKLSTEFILSILRSELNKHRANNQFEIDLDNPHFALTLPVQVQRDLEFKSVNYDTMTGRFQALAKIPLSETRQTIVPIYGRAYDVVDVPVVIKQLRQGDVISAQDISYITLPENRTNETFVLNQSDLIGMTPKRAISPDQPIRSTDIMQPNLVKRGDVVQMIVKTNHIYLSAQGRALLNGAEGDVVRVANLDSGQVVQGRVTGYQQITINPTIVSTDSNAALETAFNQQGRR